MRTLVVELAQFIGGTWITPQGPFVADINPARTDDLVARAPLGTTNDVDLAVEGAHSVSAQWARTSLRERGVILARASDLLSQRAQVLGAELTREEGKTLSEGVAEVKRAADIFRYFSAEATREIGSVFASSRDGESVLVVHRPIGVVAVITPWNFPIAIPAWKIAPALVYGNAVVWKPASLVPLLAFRLSEILVEAGLPPGILSLVLGSGSIGEYLAGHRGVSGVSFTGSTDVGRHLARVCADRGTPIQTEMGGKNFCVIFSDAHLESSVKEVVMGAMLSTGQKCTATSRLIVEQEIAEDVMALLAEEVAALRVGNGLDPDVTVGPVASGSARASVLQHLNRAISQGASIIAGGEPYSSGPLAEGYFVPPTVLDLPGRGLDVWREEVFGPVLSVVRSRDRDEAFEMANDSCFGLSGSIFTNDFGWIDRAIRQLEVGMLHVNSETTGADPHVPFGGIKQSGSGPKEQGRAAIHFFTEEMTVYLRPQATRPR